MRWFEKETGGFPAVYLGRRNRRTLSWRIKMKHEYLITGINSKGETIITQRGIAVQSDILAVFSTMMKRTDIVRLVLDVAITPSN